MFWLTRHWPTTITALMWQYKKLETRYKGSMYVIVGLTVKGEPPGRLKDI